MAGMLPGVEAARRRRFHSSNNNLNHHNSQIFTCSGPSRRSSLCLHALQQHQHRHQWQSAGLSNDCDGAVGDSPLSTAAREAKKRLDERLQLQRRSSETKRSGRIDEQATRAPRTAEAVPPKASKKKMNWLRLRWMWGEPEECAVCLEGLRGGTLMQLRCGHRFHSSCLLPWLETNPHCPCCRLNITSSKTKSCNH